MPPEEIDDNISDGSDVYGAATETVEAPELPAGSETSSDPAESEASNHDSSPQETGETNDEDGHQTPVAATPAKPAFDERAIADAVAKATAQVLQPRQAQAKPQLTPEQINNLLKPVKVTADHLKHFGIAEPTPEQVSAVQQLFEQPAQNAIAVAKLMMQHQQEQFIRENQHIVEYYNRQQAEQHRNTFYTTNSDLKGFEDVVELVANKVSDTNPDGSAKSDVQIMKEVAVATRSALTKLGVQLKPAQPANHGAGQRKSSVPTMPSLQRPGRSLGAPSNGSANNPDADIYT